MNKECNIKRDIRMLKMDNPWIVPYMKRKVRFEKEGADAIFDCDYMPPVSASMDNLVFFVNFTTKNGCLYDFDYQKYLDISEGHGRPYPKDKAIDKTDISCLVSILEAYTVPRAEPILDDLLRKVMGRELAGWKIEKNLKQKLVFSSLSEDSEVSISKKNIMKALECSFSYIEILSDPDFWDANKQTLDSKHSSIYIALFSLVDKTIYSDLPELISMMNHRDQQTRKWFYREKAITAARDNDIETLKQLLRFDSVRLSWEEIQQGVIPPLAYAAKNDNLQMVQLLMDNHVYAEEEFYYCGEKRVPATFSIENGNEQIFDLITKNAEERGTFYYSDSSMICAAVQSGNLSIIEKVAKMNTSYVDLHSITDVDILDKVSYNRNQRFSQTQILALYNEGRYEALRRVLRERNPYTYNEVGSDKLIFNTAAKNGIKEALNVLKSVYAPITTWVFSSVLDSLPKDSFTQSENDELVKAFIEHRETLSDDPYSEKSSVLTYHSHTMELIEYTVKYCSDDTIVYILKCYCDSLRARAYPERVKSIIDYDYPRGNKEFFYQYLPQK